MDAAMIEAGLADQINAIQSSRELRDWREKTKAAGHTASLTDEARHRLYKEYTSRLSALLQVELAGTP